ncbi:transglycosylase domain-containing protein [Massilia consociata]|uniref:Transglycosylase domain-containing protein n=1 Tax=Massilia consociata TaxID=760117 RepID=A0ABV6FJS7_9BURK
MRKRWLPGYVLAVAIVYLLSAAAWAWASFDDAIASFKPLETIQLSKRQTAILLRVEDPAFYEHAGVSIGAGHGVATISSALARDVFLLHGEVDGLRGALQGFYRGVFNCCKRIDLGRDVMALVLDARMSKQAQLALYGASVYMGTHRGRQIAGLDEAARSYLGKPLATVTEQEFIRLVAMIKAPNHYHPSRNPAALDERAARIAALLAGRCAPDGWFDSEFAGCAGQRRGAEAI